VGLGSSRSAIHCFTMRLHSSVTSHRASSTPCADSSAHICSHTPASDPVHAARRSPGVSRCLSDAHDRSIARHHSRPYRWATSTSRRAARGVKRSSVNGLRREAASSGLSSRSATASVRSKNLGLSSRGATSVQKAPRRCARPLALSTSRCLSRCASSPMAQRGEAFARMTSGRSVPAAQSQTAYAPSRV
jgi:hypothetical protein